MASALACASLWLLASLAAAQSTAPVFEVDFPYPAADKPQSKLRFDRGTWWALLPRTTGPSPWERTREGWIERTASPKR